MFSQRMSCSFVITFGLLCSAFSANILAIFPHTGKSHFDVYEPLVLALAGRGHSLTVLSFYPQKTPVPNYTDINLVGLVPLRVNQVQFSSVENSVSDFISMAEMGLEMCEKILTFPKVRESLTAERRFDLAIVEFFNTNCFLGLVHKYGVPFVGITSASPYPEHEGLVGTPSEPAYVPHADLPFDHRMTLLQRVINVVYSATLRTIGGYYAAREKETVGRLLGEMPPLSSVARNVSLMLVNTHHSMLRARPLTPSYVQVGGIHIHQQKPLSKVSSSQHWVYSLFPLP